jgi:F0F1-type ATP synthase membrane subunit b/b'
MVLERNVEHLNHQVDTEKQKAKQALMAKDTEINVLTAKVASLESCLDAARKAIIDAMTAETKDEAMGVAIAAISGTIPGASAYIAELRTAADVDTEDQLSEMLKQASAVAARLAAAAHAGSEGSAAIIPHATLASRYCGVAPCISKADADQSRAADESACRRFGWRRRRPAV